MERTKGDEKGGERREGRRAADVGFEQKLSEGRDEILKRNSSLLRCSRTLSFFLSLFHNTPSRLSLFSFLSLAILTIFLSHIEVSILTISFSLSPLRRTQDRGT